MRVIGSNGEQIGIVSREVALKLALEEGLDLVEISPLAKPPVCKILDYSKFLYNEEKKHKAQHKAHKIEIKEVRLRPNIEEHDFNTKKKQIEKFILNGNKVKLSLSFKGREITKPELGMRVMERICQELEPMVEFVSRPTKDGKSITAIMIGKTLKK